MILDSGAKFIRLVGKLGPGPGELQYPAILLARGDSLVIGDMRGDAGLFDAAGQFVRTIAPRITSLGDLLVMRGDTLLLTEPLYTEARFGLPLHVIAPTGDTVRSFGAEDRSFDSSVPLRMYRHLAAESDSTFWVARIDRYELQRWHINGSLLHNLRPTRTWFPPMEREWDGTTAVAYPTILKSIYVHPTGGIYVLLERARSDFAPTGKRTFDEEEKTKSLTDRLTYMEQVVEVIDGTTGGLKATFVNKEGYLLQFVEDGRLVGVTAGPDGSEWPIIYRVVAGPTNH